MKLIEVWCDMCRSKTIALVIVLISRERFVWWHVGYLADISEMSRIEDVESISGKRTKQVTLCESLSGKFNGRGGMVWPKLLNAP